MDQKLATGCWLVVAGISLFLLVTSFQRPKASYAQQGLEATNVFEIKDSGKVADGDIVITSSDGITLATRGYDPKLFGVVQKNPVIVYRKTDGSGLPVVRSGTAIVNVTTLNGPIKTGDYVTSSEIAGKGQKAGISGYSVGVALEGFDGKNGEKITIKNAQNQSQEVNSGKIQVAIKIEYAEITGSRSLGRAFDYLNGAFFKNVQDPEKFTQVVRYIAAALAVIISFAVAFFTFSRSLPKAMEAIGRNPLAANTIRVSIVLNIIFTILSALVGIIAAIIIVKL